MVCVWELQLKPGIVGEGHMQSGLCWGCGVGFCCSRGVYGVYVAWPGRKKYVLVMIMNTFLIKHFALRVALKCFAIAAENHEP